MLVRNGNDERESKEVEDAYFRRKIPGQMIEERKVEETVGRGGVS